MAEYIISLVIFSLVTIVMIIIGISQMRSKKPVGFYSGEKPPREEELSDVVAWNKKHGYMWVAYGLIIIGFFVMTSFIKSETIAMVLLLSGIIGSVPIMMLYHSYLKKKYYK
ncbi:MAG: hypothetical protein IKC46_13765 [Lachnospiraceae bacterium]|nr:hypothetical protein [Lachnospiraceae bacterium]